MVGGAGCLILTIPTMLQGLGMDLVFCVIRGVPSILGYVYIFCPFYQIGFLFGGFRYHFLGDWEIFYTYCA